MRRIFRAAAADISVGDLLPSSSPSQFNYLSVLGTFWVRRLGRDEARAVSRSLGRMYAMVTRSEPHSGNRRRQYRHAARASVRFRTELYFRGTYSGGNLRCR